MKQDQLAQLSNYQLSRYTALHVQQATLEAAAAAALYNLSYQVEMQAGDCMSFQQNNHAMHLLYVHEQLDMRMLVNLQLHALQLPMLLAAVACQIVTDRLLTV